MPKYKIEIAQTDYYIIDIKAKDQSTAEKKALKKFNEHYKNGTLHYYENQDQEIHISQVFDVTNTDDPFNP